MRRLALSDEILLNIEKPARYIGGEINSVKKDIEKVDIRFCMGFPDSYEIGMSHLGMQILYDVFNSREDTYCERVFSPWMDLDSIMREKNIPLFALESQSPVKDFDFLGITLQYEMSYTNVLQILDLSHIPLYAKDRTKEDPIVIGGGPCSYNPEPLADFFDIFYIGEGETAYNEILDLYKEFNEAGKSRIEYLEAVSKIEGIYVPMFYEVSYNEDNTIKEFKKTNDQCPDTIIKQIEMDLSQTIYPKRPIVPFVQVVQDRIVLEIQRGCIRGCRFCQAGMIYRPVRERSIEFLKEIALKSIESTGHDVISLSSLSTSDYTELEELMEFLMEESNDKGLRISLPSLRIDGQSLDLMGKVQNIKRSSLTFAPEAGSDRLLNVINKGLTRENILKGANEAFQLGWEKVKLYFMLGLPTETYEDVEGIAILSDEMARKYYEMPKEKRQRRVDINVSTSFFIPKAFTPFQWVAMDSPEDFMKKQEHLYQKINEQLNRRSIKYQWHKIELSQIESVFSRGDRRLSTVLHDAYKMGCMYDSWTEHFKYDHWIKAFKKNNIDIKFYTERKRSIEEILPWDFIDIGVTKKFLHKEFIRATKESVTPNCKEGCSYCGAQNFGCGICFYERDQA